MQRSLTQFGHTSVLALVAVAGIALSAAPTRAQPQALAAAIALSQTAETPPKDWNLPKRSTLALQGYDPVSYIADGKATLGAESITATHRGVTYRFTTQAHRDAFVAKPQAYEPAYGGWCAWAMKDGEKVDIDPKAFIVKDGRTYLFYDGFWGNTRAKWLKEDHAAQAKAADAKWKAISGEDPPAPESAPVAITTSEKLQPSLDAVAAKFTSQMTPQQQDTYESSMKAIADTGVAKRALQAGAKAPDFDLPAADGKRIKLSEALANGPVVVMWYRGGWCPFCNLQLRAMEARLDDLEASGASLIAISPQLPDSTVSTKDANELTFPVLSDVGNTAAKAYGLTYELPPAQLAMLGKLLEKTNGDTSTILPIAATYVIDRNGIIAQAFTDSDYRKRPEPDDVIKAVQALKR
jgi:peroxiredoxin